MARNRNQQLARLLDRIQDRKALIGVIGLGYVGLPLARAFTLAGTSVLGFDVDSEKVRMLRAGKSYIASIPAVWVKEMRRSGRFDATDDFAQLRRADCIIICVPTPLDRTRQPDISYIKTTAEAIAKRLRPGQLIVLESTTYPGTTREVVMPVLERAGLKAGKDFFLAFSPEREDPGRKDYNTRTIPKLVGGLNPASLQAALACYRSAIKTVIPVSSCEVAEAAKILENTYRCINIALVNELKILFDRMGIDVWEVIAAAATKPFGFTAFYPGPGMGGHCIPIDPFYLAWKAREYGLTTQFIELAGEINITMPRFVVEKTIVALNRRRRSVSGARILVLGLAYKKDIDDERESPSREIIELLLELGAKVDYNDPNIPLMRPVRRHKFAMRSKPLGPRMLAGYDAVIICTDHSAYDYGQIVRHAKLIIDTRNAARSVRRGRRKIVKA